MIDPMREYIDRALWREVMHALAWVGGSMLLGAGVVFAWLHRGSRR